MGRRFREAFWPTPQQEQLLAIALDEDADVATAWSALRPRFDLDRLEAGSFSLLPLVYARLTQAGVADDLLPRLKGVVRSTWYRNNLLLERADESLRALERADVAAVTLGGLASAARFYGELGLRPTPMLELLVPETKAASATVALSSAAWRERADDSADDRRVLADDAGHTCVVRTSVAVDFQAPELLAGAQPFEVRERRLQTFSPTDELLVACVTGARMAPQHTIVWIADAVRIVRSEESIDWERLADLGVEHGQALRLRDALGYLAERRSLPLPREVLDRLSAARVSTRERLVHTCLAGRPRMLRGLPSLVGEHLARHPHRSLLRVVADVPGLLRHRRWAG